MSPEEAKTAKKAHVRARKLGKQKTWDGVPDAEIFKRAGWECQLGCWCAYPGLPIDPEAPWNSELAPEPDHVIPLSLGGIDVSTNKRAAHRICNQRRQNKMSEDETEFMNSHPELRLTPEQLEALPPRKRRELKPEPPKPVATERICDIPECAVAFSATGRKKYCSPVCAEEGNRRRNREAYTPKYGRQPRRRLSV